MTYQFNGGASHATARIATLVGATALVLGLSLPSWAVTPLDANKKCRSGIGAQLTNVVKTGLLSQDKCQQLAAKLGVPSDICNSVDALPFTIINGGKYEASQSKAEKTLLTNTSSAPYCSVANTPDTLENYPNNNTSETYPNISDLLTGSANVILGGADLDADKVKSGCRQAVAKAQQKVTTTMIAEALKCQKAYDKTKLNLPDFQSGLARFGLLGDCLAANTKVTDAITSASNTIIAKCNCPACAPAPKVIPGWPSGASIGSCDTLPNCVTDAALAAGKNLALAMYPAQDCDGSPTPAGRTVTVSLDSGVPLGGADVRLEYPRFQAGIPNNGVATEVQDAIITSNFFQATDRDGAVDVSLVFSPALTSGEAFQAKLDKCEAFSQGLCSVTTAQTCGQSKDCSAHCRELAEGGTAPNTNTTCTVNADCPAPPVSPPGLIQECVCPTCQSKRCIGPNANVLLNATCTLNANCPGAGGGFCVASETCIPQSDHCSVSQYLSCVAPSDCPTGEDCTTQGALTKCTVVDAFDEFANEVDGVTCSINVTEP